MPSFTVPPYDIGTPGQPWGEAEKARWLSVQRVQRSYQQEVVDPLLQLFETDRHPQLLTSAECFSYGCLDYSELGLGQYKLYAVRTRTWDHGQPFFLITGGVHGYETSGVQGGIRFIADKFAHYAARANVLHLVCVSPWGYETINRWNPFAVDPNRSFWPEPATPEAQCVIDLLSQYPTPLLHIDLHETTNTDATEFRPAKAARDGLPLESCHIPDGFYLYADQNRPEPEFQAAIIDSVSRITHIAPVDADGTLLGVPLVQHGVIQSFKRQQGICSGWTDARYITTTEVYPDHPDVTLELSIQVQVTALCAGLDHVLGLS